ncbi:MarR family protein [Vreelandella songnenensis]|uniref:MarR family protein n=1 Tax=Vreelandella songnenensis TaxID=1176243 RepID=A0A2T0V455_9GAMM|nr:MarR family transcriptional regulator [Halomonas songnenensis]PRY64965.1 MarR family protein [Halomonas songnenensis]
MPDTPADRHLQRALNALQADHPELDPLAALVLLALASSPSSEKGVSSALLARRLDIEHALILRACTTLEEAGWVSTQPAGGASPALRVCLIASAGDQPGLSR